MTLTSCTPLGATSGGRSCTPVGATAVSYLAPFFVQHRGADLAPPPVQHTLHPRWFNNEYPYLLTHSRHALTCKTDVYSYRSSRRPTLTYRTAKVTTDRAGGKESK